MESGNENDKTRDPGNLSEKLRTAIERTIAATAATAGTAAENTGRGRDLLDEVSKRGSDIARRSQEAREDLARRGSEAREVSSGAASRLVDAIEGIRLASREDIHALEDRLDQLEKVNKRLTKRVSKLESKGKVKG